MHYSCRLGKEAEMLNIEKLKIGQKIYNKYKNVDEYAIVQSISKTGKVCVKYKNDKPRVYNVENLTRQRHVRGKGKKRKEDSFALDVLDNLPKKQQQDIWKLIANSGLTVREVLEIKELLPKEK